MVGRDHRSGARHVLSDDLRLTRDILAHVSRKETGPAVVESTRRGTHHDANCFSLVERVSLRPRHRGELRREKEKRETDQGKRLHLHDNLHSTVQPAVGFKVQKEAGPLLIRNHRFDRTISLEDDLSSFAEGRSLTARLYSNDALLRAASIFSTWLRAEAKLIGLRKMAAMGSFIFWKRAGTVLIVKRDGCRRPLTSCQSSGQETVAPGNGRAAKGAAMVTP